MLPTGSPAAYRRNDAAAGGDPRAEAEGRQRHHGAMNPALSNAPEILGLGIDIVEVPRFSAFLARHDASLTEVFTASEVAAADQHHSRVVYLATRWACKEAFLKALGTGWGGGVQWTDVEVLGHVLAPRVLLKGMAARKAGRMGAGTPIASIAWAGSKVIALAVLAGFAADPDGGREHAIPPG